MWKTSKVPDAETQANLYNDIAYPTEIWYNDSITSKSV